MNGGLKGVKSLLSPARYSRRCDRRHSAIIHVIRSASVVWGKERVALQITTASSSGCYRLCPNLRRSWATQSSDLLQYRRLGLTLWIHHDGNGAATAWTTPCTFVQLNGTASGSGSSKLVAWTYARSRSIETERSTTCVRVRALRVGAVPVVLTLQPLPLRPLNFLTSNSQGHCGRTFTCVCACAYCPHGHILVSIR